MNFSELFVKIIEMSAVASVIALVVMLIRRFAGRAIPKGVMFALWSVVILKLLIPISIPSPVSLYNVVDIENAHASLSAALEPDAPISPEIPTVMLPESETPIAPEIPSVSVPEDPVYVPSLPSDDIKEPSTAVPDTPNAEDVPLQTGGTEITITESAESPKISYLVVIEAVYCSVTAVIALAILASYVFTAIRIGKSETVNDKRVNGILADLPAASGISVKKRSGQRSIMIFGIFRPTVILPEDYKSLSDTELTYLLMHEYQHYRHFDTLWNLFMLAASAIHWFNPLVWLTRKYFLCDMETACDARVLKRLPDGEKTVFAEVLVSFAARCSRERSVVAMGFGKRNVKERVLSIMKYKKTGALAITASAVIVAAVVSVFATGAYEPKAPDEIPEITETAETVETEPEETEPEETAPEVTDPAETKPEETTGAETESEEAEPSVRVISAEKGAVMSELAAFVQEHGLSGKNEDSVILELSDVDGLSLTASLKKEGDSASAVITKVHVGDQSYDVSFDDVLAEYANAVLDIVSAGDRVSVGMRNYLGTYYVFTEVGYSRFEMTDSEGYYIWSDGADLWYMKQNRDFERISAGMQVFAHSYSSPDQFYMDFGKIVSVSEGKLGITETKWTVQDYFMSDTFVMSAERDSYGYDSVEEFVADYNAGTLGAEEETMLYPLPNTGMEGERVPETEPIISCDMKKFVLHVDTSSEWMRSVLPGKVIEYSHAVIGDYANFKAFVAGLDSVSNSVYENVADGTIGTAKHTELFEAYDESFFNEKALVAVYINAQNLECGYEIHHILFEDDKQLSIYIDSDDGIGEYVHPMTESRLYVIELDRDVILYSDSIIVRRYYEFEPIDPSFYNQNLYGNNPVDFSKDMVNSVSPQPTFPTIPAFNHPKPVIPYPNRSVGNTDPWKNMTSNR